METNSNATPKKDNSALYGFLFIVIVIVIVVGSTLYFNKTKKTASQTVQETVSVQNSGSANPTVSSSISAYKDGTYSADGSYSAPGGVETIGVTITLKNDVITDSSVTDKSVDRESREYQDNFAANYKQFVIGKNISSVQLDKVSSSSLTPNGFNKAIQQIESQAKA
jgi:uncharacterized protein with FMN-binding domain